MLFRVNTPDVIQETVEGEVIIVHLVTGSYYSLRGSGAAIWAAVTNGVDEESVIRQFADPAASDREVVAAAVRRFLRELQDEALLVPAEPNGSIASASAWPQSSGASEPFAEPVIEKYSDMQELLLLDPIHEVDAGGWPSTKEKPDG